jgi:hypothetical protein
MANEADMIDDNLAIGIENEATSVSYSKKNNGHLGVRSHQRCIVS